MNTHQINELKTLVSGSVAVAGDKLYATASQMLFKTITPSAVVRPSSSEDVAVIVRFAKKYQIPFAIRSGGHNNIASRLANNILLIDMSGLATVEVVDTQKGLVRVGSGALWHEVASKLDTYNLGLSSGDTRTVGVGGLATGGGLGWMIRKYGPVIDTIINAEIVLADGTIKKIDAINHPDLFWAIRGGGSNFGIVTYFTFAAHTTKGVHVGEITYSIKNAAAIIKGWRDAMRHAPAELTTMLMTFPAMGESPASILIKGCFEGADAQTAAQAYAPFLKLGDVLHHEIKPMPYKDVLENGMPPQNMRVVVHNAFLKEFTNEAIDAITRLFKEVTPILQIRHVAGAMNEQPADATAFSHRDSEVLIVNPTFVAPNASDKEVEAALTAWHVIQPFSNGCYLNLLSEDTGKEITDAFPPPALQRLRAIKAAYDPENIFKTNYNITPAQ